MQGISCPKNQQYAILTKCYDLWPFLRQKCVQVYGYIILNIQLTIKQFPEISHLRALYPKKCNTSSSKFRRQFEQCMYEGMNYCASIPRA